MSESDDIVGVIAIAKRDKPHNTVLIMELEALLAKAQEREKAEMFHVSRIAELLTRAGEFGSQTGFAQFMYRHGIRMAPEVNYIPNKVAIKNVADGEVSAPKGEA